MKKMKGMDLEIGCGYRFGDCGGDDDFLFDGSGGGSSSSMGSGITQPPPIDSLDGIKVII